MEHCTCIPWEGKEFCSVIIHSVHSSSLSWSTSFERGPALQVPVENFPRTIYSPLHNSFYFHFHFLTEDLLMQFSSLSSSEIRILSEFFSNSSSKILSNLFPFVLILSRISSSLSEFLARMSNRG